MIHRSPGFLRSYDSAPRLPPCPISRQQDVSLSQSSCGSLVELSDERGNKGVGKEQNHTNGRKTGPLNHSTLSVSTHPSCRPLLPHPGSFTFYFPADFLFFFSRLFVISLFHTFFRLFAFHPFSLLPLFLSFF
jgi:hypothetical protein